MATAEWKPYASGEKWVTKIMLNGMTNNDVADLVPLAKSWLDPAGLKLEGSAFKSEGYDPTQMAYVLQCKEPGASLKFTLAADKDSPVVNPAFVIKNWGDSDVQLKINGDEADKGKDFRSGVQHNLDGTDLIVWVKTETTDPIKISLLASE
jgi:hypothetical protein